MALLKGTTKYRLLAERKTLDSKAAYPWLAPSGAVATGGHSSWVKAVEWVPNGTLQSTVKFKTKKKWYSLPSIHYSLFLFLIDIKNVPYNGVGSRMWEFGFLGFSQKAFDRYTAKLKDFWKKDGGGGTTFNIETTKIKKGKGRGGGYLGAQGFPKKGEKLSRSQAQELVKRIQNSDFKIKQKGARMNNNAFEELLISLFTIGTFGRGLIGAAAIAKIFS